MCDGLCFTVMFDGLLLRVCVCLCLCVLCLFNVFVCLASKRVEWWCIVCLVYGCLCLCVVVERVRDAWVVYCVISYVFDVVLVSTCVSVLV